MERTEHVGGGDGVACRGIRGATILPSATPEAVREATAELLAELGRANGFDPEDVAAAIFTLTDDLARANPAAAARAAGWDSVPLLMVREHGGDASVANCLRVLLLVNTALNQHDVRHIYLRGAASLRPDLATLS
jgi:chorismate mutase